MVFAVRREEGLQCSDEESDYSSSTEDFVTVSSVTERKRKPQVIVKFRPHHVHDYSDCSSTVDMSGEEDQEVQLGGTQDQAAVCQTTVHRLASKEKTSSLIFKKAKLVEKEEVPDVPSEAEAEEDTDADELGGYSEDESGDDCEQMYPGDEEDEQNFREAQAVLNALINNYPDVDPEELRNKSISVGYQVEPVKEWLENYLATLPEKRQVQAVARLCLQDRLEAGERLWSCPGCQAWASIPSSSQVAKCKEIGCKKVFCVLCGRGDHRPLPCRTPSDRLWRAEHEVDIFQPVHREPDRVEGEVRIYQMLPRNDLDFSDPLQILYLAAEATFLRMVDRSNQQVNRRSIKSIEYVENDMLRAVFLQQKAKFLANNIPSNERLVFHGTPEGNISSILRENFRLNKCKRFAHGRGVYFSEFPEVSEGYGSGLLLCRALLGRTITGAGGLEGWESKLVNPDQEGRGHMVVVPDTRQILPVFIIHL